MDTDDPAGSSEFRFSQEMGITHEEFFRTLPAALGGRAYAVADDTVIISEGDRQLVIQLSAEGERVIASMRLPVTQVTFRFEGYTRSEVQTFMDRFKLRFQRGGG